MGVNVKDQTWKNNLRVKKKRGTGTSKDDVIPIIRDNTNEVVADLYADKHTAHKYGLLHESVHIVIISKDGKKILLAQRANNKPQWPGYWDITVGEHIIKGDKSPQAAAENAFEVELGYPWRTPNYEFTIKSILTYRAGADTKYDYELRHVYVMKADDLDIDAINKGIDPKETIQIKWFTKEEFDEYLAGGEIIDYKYFYNAFTHDDFIKLFQEQVEIFKSTDSSKCEVETRLFEMDEK